MDFQKFELIKEYPGSPTLGTIVTLGIDFNYNNFINGVPKLKNSVKKEYVENNPEFWECLGDIMLTTYDKIPICKGEEVYYVSITETKNSKIFFPYKFNWKNIRDIPNMRKNYKWFASKEKAKNWITKNKPIQKDLKYYETFLLKTHIDCDKYLWLKSKNPKLYYLKVLQIITKDLNWDWEPDWNNPNQSKYQILGQNNKIIVIGLINTYCRINTVFKNRLLAEKAIQIMGNKLNCIFNY